MGFWGLKKVWAFKAHIKKAHIKTWAFWVPECVNHRSFWMPSDRSRECINVSRVLFFRPCGAQITQFKFSHHKMPRTCETTLEKHTNRVGHKFLATQARDDAEHYQHSEIGYNYRMSNVCAAIGLGQLEVLSDRVIKKRESYNKKYCFHRRFFSY